jgi:MFS family permease
VPVVFRDAPGPVRSPWALVAVLGFAGTSVSFMQTLVVPIQNHLPVLVDASRSSTAWVLTVALLAAAVTTPISGRLGDITGKRKVALALMALLLAGSLIAALSQGLGWLLVGRALQGASMGIIAVGISILGDQPDPRQRVSGIAFISASLGFGGAIGLPLSAWIVQVGDWKLLFWSSAVLGVLNFALIWLVVPPSRGSRQRLDLPGAFGLAVGLSGILIAISQGPVWGWISPLTLGTALGGATVLVVWGFYQLQIDEPMVDLRLLSRRPLLLVNLGTVALGFSFFISEVAFLQILELPAGTEAGLGLSMITASIALVPSALAMMAAAPLAARLTHRHGGRVAACIGALTSAAAYAFTIVWHDQVWHLVLSSSVLLAGVAIGYAAIPTLVMAEVSRDATGSANGVNALMRSIGTSSGATVTGMVLAASSVRISGNEVPQASGFVTVFALGLIAAVASAALIWLSRSSRARGGREAGRR